MCRKIVSMQRTQHSKTNLLLTMSCNNSQLASSPKLAILAANVFPCHKTVLCATVSNCSSEISTCVHCFVCCNDHVAWELLSLTFTEEPVALKATSCQSFSMQKMTFFVHIMMWCKASCFVVAFVFFGCKRGQVATAQETIGHDENNCWTTHQRAKKIEEK